MVGAVDRVRALPRPSQPHPELTITSILLADWSWRNHHKPFARIGETFILVSPFEVFVLTDSAEVIHQVSQQREKFPKIHEVYEILRQYGENVISAEGPTWKRHRKVTAPSFTEKNVGKVFVEAVRQAQSMTRMWTTGEDGTPNKETIYTLNQDTSTFALHVIGYVGFDLRMVWPGESLPDDTDPRLAKFSGLGIPEGYTMSFADAMVGNIGTIFWQMIAPRWLLRAWPSEATRYAAEARDNYDRYIDELIKIKIEDAQGGKGELGMDFVGHLVKTKYGPQTEKTARMPQLSHSEIEGNTFVMFTAGHETTANATHFTLAHLAATPTAQRLVQRDIDAVFGRDTDPRTWKYNDIIQPMSASMVGAAMNETLRVVPGIGELPKYVNPEKYGLLTIKGSPVVLPPNAHILIVPVSVHRNPNAWPTRPSRVTGKADDMDDYLPERWYRAADGDEAKKAEQQEGIEEENDSFRFADTSDRMFRPPPGAYLPFGDGPRSCIGRRIAQAEVMAAVAVVFQKYSIELAVDEWATDVEVARMSEGERKALYKKAQARFKQTMGEVSSLLTLKLPPGEFIPIRVVPRGEERFVHFVDDDLE
jgi:cytochrome P450